MISVAESYTALSVSLFSDPGSGNYVTVKGDAQKEPEVFQ